MTISDELTALNTNLTAAKNAVTAKGGTVGDTGLAGLASEIATIPSGGTEPSSGATLTAYDSTTGVLTGTGLGTSGTVYLLDRDTNSYVAQPTSSWSATSITLTTPIDLSTIEGTTSIVAVDPDGKYSTKLLITGSVAVTGFAKLYVQDSDTRVVRTIAVSSSDFDNLYNSTNNGFGVQRTIDGDTFYFDEIVGVQFGSDFDLTLIGSSFLRYAVNLNQPVVLPSSVTSIRSYFLSYCFSFNQPLDLSSITSIWDYFLQACYPFNQPLDLPSITSIGSNFLVYCHSFNQPIDLSSATSIGDYFLSDCRAFNQPLDLSSITSIRERFLQNCYSFNQPLDLSSITSIGGYSFYQCLSFNQPLDLSSVTFIGPCFLYQCASFNQPLDLPSITSIEANFLARCFSFNHPLIVPSTVTSIGNEFLSYCYSFNQPLTIPSSVTSIGRTFLYNCSAFSNITVETTACPTDNYSLSSDYATAKMNVKGVTVTGAGASDWITALPDRSSSPYRKLINGNE